VKVSALKIDKNLTFSFIDKDINKMCSFYFLNDVGERDIEHVIYMFDDGIQMYILDTEVPAHLPRSEEDFVDISREL